MDSESIKIEKKSIVQNIKFTSDHYKVSIDFDSYDGLGNVDISCNFRSPIEDLDLDNINCLVNLTEDQLEETFLILREVRKEFITERNQT